MADQIQITVYKIDDSTQEPPIILSTLTSNIKIREATVENTSAVKSIVYYYDNPNALTQFKSLYVSETIDTILGLCNIGTISQVRATVVDIDGTSQEGNKKYNFPVDKIVIFPYISGIINSFIEFKGNRYFCIETESQLRSAINNNDGPISIDTQVFTSDSTWTKPSFGNFVRIVCIGAGGGGAAGFRAAANEFGTASGGGGGGGGGYTDITLPINQVPDTESIYVGQGGIGGSAATEDFSGGTEATDGGFSSFGFSINGALVVATGGQAGRLSTDTSSLGGSAGIGMFNGSTGGDGDTGDGSSAVNTNYGCGAGGSGGGWDTFNTHNGGDGSCANGSILNRANGGIAPRGDGENGNTFSTYTPAGGGGGGASSNGVSSAGNGGNGATYGAGGGGGGGSISGFNSGNGGNGGNGIVIVYVF